MSWFGNVIRNGPETAPKAPSNPCREIERAVHSGERMLSTLLEAYGNDSVLVRQQISYLDTLRRELSACRAA